MTSDSWEDAHQIRQEGVTELAGQPKRAEALPGNQVKDWIREQLCYGGGLPRFPLYNTPLDSLLPVLSYCFSDLAPLLDTSSLALPSEASSCLTLLPTASRRTELLNMTTMWLFSCKIFFTDI